TWTLAGAGFTYNDAGAGGSLTFAGFAPLQGGSGKDTFNVSTAIGAIDLRGGAGDDTFTFSGSGSSTGTIDGQGNNDTITGNDAGDPFHITGANAGSIDTILANGFTNVENLVGGTGNDSFVFTTGGSLNGTINGDGGTDTITGDNAGDTFHVTSSDSGSIDTLLGSFIGVENLVGGTGGDGFVFATRGSPS